MTTPISQFQKEYRWLSNFAPAIIGLNGFIYASVEHAYQSAKSDSVIWKIFCSNKYNSAGLVKKMSYREQLIPNWEESKCEIMLDCLRKKYAQPPYRKLLLETGDRELIEGNWHGDDFWGFCLKTQQGQNVLGKLIMQVRGELRENLI